MENEKITLSQLKSMSGLPSSSDIKISIREVKGGRTCLIYSTDDPLTAYTPYGGMRLEYGQSITDDNGKLIFDGTQKPLKSPEQPIEQAQEAVQNYDEPSAVAQNVDPSEGNLSPKRTSKRKNKAK